MLPGVPAYFYPWPRSRDWDRVLALPAGSVVVVNPATGPGASPDPRYVDRTRRALDAGLVLQGYVDSAYAARPVRRLLDEAARHRDWYGVSALFVDQASPAAADLGHYRRLHDRLAEQGLALCLNPGRPPLDRGYLDVADDLVVFEGTHREHACLVLPDWLHDAVTTRTWHLVHGVRDRRTARRVVARARELGADVVLVTDGGLPNAWDHLPPYWPSLLAAVTST